MFDKLISFFKKLSKKEQQENPSKDTAKERLHLVLMQDRANVSADFLELMKQEIIEVIKKYIDIDEKSIDVRLTNKSNEDGTNGAPALYANIPILNVRNDMKKEVIRENEKKDNKDNEEEKDTEEIKNYTESEFIEKSEESLKNERVEETDENVHDISDIQENEENISINEEKQEDTNEIIEVYVEQENSEKQEENLIEENNKNRYNYNANKKKNRKKKHKYR